MKTKHILLAALALVAFAIYTAAPPPQDEVTATVIKEKLPATILSPQQPTAKIAADPAVWEKGSNTLVATAAPPRSDLSASRPPTAQARHVGIYGIIVTSAANLGGSTSASWAAAREMVGAGLVVNGHQKQRSGGASLGATKVVAGIVTDEV